MIIVDTNLTGCGLFFHKGNESTTKRQQSLLSTYKQELLMDNPVCKELFYLFPVSMTKSKNKLGLMTNKA